MRTISRREKNCPLQVKLQSRHEILLHQKELMVTLLCCRIASIDNIETIAHCSIPKWVKHGRVLTANSTLLMVIFGQKLNVKSVKALQCFNANTTPSSVINCDPKLNSSRSSRYSDAICKPESEIRHPSKPMDNNRGRSLEM